MIKATVKLEDGTKLQIEAKTSWNELTYSELLQIESQSDNLDPLMLFSILTGTKFDEIANSKDDSILELFTQIVGFVYDTPDWKEIDCPTKLPIGKRLYDIPQDMNDISIGQKILLGQLSQEKDLNVMKLIPRATAIMMINAVHGSFNKDSSKLVGKLEEEILKSNAIAVYGAGQFFFLNSSILSSIGKSSLTMSLKQKARMQLAS